MYSDVVSILKEVNPFYLTHALIGKWIIILLSSYVSLKNLLNLDWNLSASKIYKLLNKSKKNKSYKNENFGEIQNLKDIEEGLAQYRDLQKYPRLESEINEILREK